MVKLKPKPDGEGNHPPKDVAHVALESLPLFSRVKVNSRSNLAFQSELSKVSLSRFRLQQIYRHTYL